MSKALTSVTHSRDSSPTASQLPALSEDERRVVVEDWNQTSAPYPASTCLHQLFEAQVALTPGAPAIQQEGRKLSYAEVNAKANQLAHYLRSSGVRQGDLIAICLGSSPEFLISLLAVLKAGGACVPLDPAYPKQRLAFMLRDVRARVIVTQAELRAQLEPLATPTIDLASVWPFVEQQNSQNLPETSAPENSAYIIYTSGSTGTPKGVLLPHRGLVNHGTASVKLYGLCPGDRMLQFSSISFDIAIEEIFPTWLAGGTVVLKSAGFSLGFAEFSEFVRKNDITVLDLPTAYWHEWTNHLFENRQSPAENLRLVIVGGEKVSAPILRRWQTCARNQVRWINTYGPSEASVIATAYEPEASEIEALSSVPIGRPIANTRIYVLGPGLDPVAAGEPGELCIGGVGVASGYLNRPELTAEKFVVDPFGSKPNGRLYRTGDRVRYRPNGEIEFLGREDDQVKIRGFRVEPGEIEGVLGDHSAVAEAAVVAREGSEGEKRLIAFVVVARDSSFNESGLREYLQQRLPDYMVPSVFVTLPAMPKTSNGKVDRRALLEVELPAQSETGIAAGEDPLQRKLLKIWRDVLSRPVGLRDNFFEVGGHSLLAAKLMHRIGQAVGRPLPLALLLEAPTVEQLAVALHQEGWSRHWSSLVAIQPEGAKPPFFCVHGVGGNVVGFRDLGRHMAPTHPFYGVQARGLDGRQPHLTTIEEMATHYLSEIRSVQPRGPYFLGGFSFGGLVAYEMAQQLHACGEEVGLLAFFDTYPGNLKPVASSLLASLRNPSWQLLTQAGRSVRRRVRVAWRMLTIPGPLREAFRSNSRAAAKCKLQAYPGQATLFRASEKSIRSDDPYAGWHQLLQGGLNINDIPGSHNGILVEPEVAVLAESLKSTIDNALANRRVLVAQ
jgi:aspartate racemase